MSWFKPTECEKWASPRALSNAETHVELSALDSHSRELFGTVLPRGVLAARFAADGPPANF